MIKPLFVLLSLHLLLVSGQSQPCIPGQNNCISCNFDGTACENCEPNYQLSSTEGICKLKCFENQNNCITCSTDNTACISCDLLYMVAADGTCQIAPCTDGQNSCITCSNDRTQCWNCDTTTILSGGICIIPPCIDGQSNCVVCSSDHLTCQICNSGYVLTSAGICIWNVDCGKGNYFDPDFQSCNTCQSKFNFCETCTKDHCNLCKMGYYWDPYYNVCSRCGNGCADCTSSSRCVRCMEPNIAPYFDGTCICYGHGTYNDPTTGRCEFCSVGCKNCDSNSCTKCWAWDAVLSGGQCVCPYYGTYGTATYQTCHSPEYKTGCVGSNDIDPWGDRACYECVVGYYQDGHQCYQCGSGCYQCTDGYTCNACIDSINSTPNSGTCQCNDGHFYFNTTNNQCMPCRDECMTCTGYDQCTICYWSTQWSSDRFTCECYDYQYFDTTSTSCQSCPTACVHCNGLQCTKCAQGYFLYDNKGVLNCKACSSSCSNCGQNDDCYQCGTTVELESNQCTNTNALGYKIRYQNGGNLILDFAYDLPWSLSIKEVIIKSQGYFDTSSWFMARLTSRQYRVYTNLGINDLPIDVRFKFNRN